MTTGRVGTVLRPRPADLVLGLVLAVAGVAITAGIDGFMAETRHFDGWGAVLVAGCALSLTTRRSAPLLTLAVATLTCSGYLLLGYSYGVILVSFLIAVYSTARHCPPRVSAIAAGAALPVLLSHILTNPASLAGASGLIPGTAWVVVPYAVGIAVRLNRQSAAQERERAVAEQIYDERIRLAQDVHDVVGHNLAAIKMQADIALHVIDRKPDQARTALAAIADSSGDALDELRSTLAMIINPSESRTPTPGLARLPDLRTRMAAAGLEVLVEIDGTARPLPPAIDVAGYRVVQESLTNVLRHSTARVATVRVGYSDDEVSLVVSNPSTGRRMPAVDGRGLGLPGLQRRVTALGGRFTAGPTTDRRFRVAAVLPIAAERTS